MGKTETSTLGIVEIVIRVATVILAVGALIGAAVTLANVDDAFPEGIDEPEGFDFEGDEDAYRDVALFVVISCSLKIVTQTILSIVRGLYFAEYFKKRFLNFAIINTITTIILSMSYISGGVSCETNAADVQDYIDNLLCDDLDNIPNILPEQRQELQDSCDHFEVLRDSMIASGVLLLFGALIFFALAVVMFMSVVKKCKEKK